MAFAPFGQFHQVWNDAFTPGEPDLESFPSHTFAALIPPVRLILRAVMVEAILDENIRESFVSEFIRR
jgi:hypothetical protein